MATMTVRRVGIFSLAKIQGLIGFVFGLIIGVIYGLIIILFGAALTSMGQSEASAAGGATIGVGIGMMIGIPIIYGIMAFIAGAIGAIIYNIAAGFVGGIELEMESAGGDYVAPPPPPNQWGANPYQQPPAGGQYPY